MSNYKLPVNDIKFQNLHWRLLLSYLTVMVAILGTFTVAIYEFFADSLYQQIDRRLIILAEAAAHSFTEIKKQYQHQKQVYQADKYSHAQVFRRLDGDGDLDIPWHSLREPDQGVEWFDSEAKLLGNSGTILSNYSLHPGFESINNGQIRMVTIAAYSKEKGKQKLEGYVRTSETTQEVEVVLIRLRWGLGLGSIFALTMTGIGGLWLTRQSLQPIIQSFQQLKQFTADASHELRSPLTVIKTSVDVMLNHPERIHPADEKKIVAIASATRQMSSLIEDLLLLARMDAQTATINQQLIPIPLDEILSDLVDFLELQAEEKEITLKSDLLTDVFVKGDATKLTRLFANLIENALQYTPKGGTVTLFIKRFDRFVIVGVEDTGMGIAAENLPFVFDRFWRADKARTHREGGLGMGLAIAQTIAQYHYGEITVTSQLGIGSCFRVRLPIIFEPKT